MWFYTAGLSLTQDSKLPARNDTSSNTFAFPETPYRLTFKHTNSAFLYAWQIFKIKKKLTINNCRSDQFAQVSEAAVTVCSIIWKNGLLYCAVPTGAARRLSVKTTAGLGFSKKENRKEFNGNNISFTEKSVDLLR